MRKNMGTIVLILCNLNMYLICKGFRVCYHFWLAGSPNSVATEKCPLNTNSGAVEIQSAQYGHFSVATKKDAHTSLDQKNNELILDPCAIYRFWNYCETETEPALQSVHLTFNDDGHARAG